MRRAIIALVALVVMGAGSAVWAADLDNNGVVGDEKPFDMQGGSYPSFLSETAYFPQASDSWSVYYLPYWWHIGDTVVGTRAMTTMSVTQADVSLKLSYNSLTPGCGYVDLDFRINGTTVGTLHITSAEGTGFKLGSFTFAAMNPPFEFRYYETNQVAGGCGSISLDSTGISTVVVTGGPTATEGKTWTAVKSLYR